MFDFFTLSNYIWSVGWWTLFKPNFSSFQNIYFDSGSWIVQILVCLFFIWSQIIVIVRVTWLVTSCFIFYQKQVFWWLQLHDNTSFILSKYCTIIETRCWQFTETSSHFLHYIFMPNKHWFRSIDLLFDKKFLKKYNTFILTRLMIYFFQSIFRSQSRCNYFDQKQT